MYSVVLLAALTAGTSAPTWGSGCHGCHGGWGGGHGGHGCHGCHGSGGCNGGYGCWGGWTSCYGCYGGYSCACYGGGGCSGCYGGGGCSGCYGGYGYGCYGAAGYGCCGGVAYTSAPMAPAMTTPAAPPAGTTTPEQVPAPKKEKATSLDQAARLIVELPADAKLYVDDKLTKATSERRVFNTPQLDPGQTYYYILRAETVRNGQTQAETKRVLLHRGEVIQTSFRDLGSVAVAQTQASGGQ